MSTTVNVMTMSVPDVMALRTQGGVSYTAKASNEIARGGEGRILTCDEDPQLVMKIYHPLRDPLSRQRFDHLNKLDGRWFIRPKDLLFQRNKLVGFTMEYLPKTYFVLQNILQKDFCKTNGITPAIKLKIIKTLVEAVKSAHSVGVVIGDLNQYNIMCDVQGNLKFIDVDSYETPKDPHSGILLDEVRDHYYQGKVTKNSDYFALSVLVFSMITFVHPFKGIHKTLKKISDRMIHKAPIFKKDPDIMPPRFYEPIQQGFLLDQFTRMYMNNVERFIIDMDGQGISSIIATATLPKPAGVKKYTEDELSVHEIMENDIRNIIVNGGRMLVKTNMEYYLYDCSNKGYVTLLEKMPSTEWDDIFLGKDTMIGIRDGEVFVRQKREAPFTRVTNFSMPSSSSIVQMDSILFILGDNSLIKLDMDKGMGSMVSYTQENVFSKAFNIFGGFFFRAGSKQLFYHLEKGHPMLSLMPLNITTLYQVGNVGMISYIEKGKGKKVVNKYFKVDGNNVVVSSRDADAIYKFGYQANGNDGFIFQPQDGFLRIVRTQDFEEIARHQLKIASTQSVVKHTGSGIVLWDNDTLYLINKR